jgi:hypothetical protein
MLQDDESWRRSLLQVFDAPHCKGDVKERIDHVKDSFPSHPNLQIVNYWQIRSMDELFQWMKEEREDVDLILKQDRMEYIQGSSISFLKVKVLTILGITNAIYLFVEATI